MSQVVYLPTEQQRTLAGDTGNMLGALVASEIGRRQRAEQQGKVKQFIDAVRNAPDRAGAFEVLSNYSPQFGKTEDYSMALRIIDEAKPASAEEVKPITMYDPEGQPTTVGMNQERFKRETDPNAVGTMFPGMSFTKPEQTDFYAPGEKDGEIKFLGKMPPSKRPEGAMTLQEIAQANAMKREVRADARDVESKRRFEAQQRQTDENQALAERRLQATLGRIGTLVGEREGRQVNEVAKDAARQIAVMSNARMLPDGSFGFDDANKAEQYRQQLDYVTGAIERDPKLLTKPGAALKLASEARKAIVGTEKPKDETPVKEKPKGLIEWMTGKGDSKAGPTASGKVTPAKGFKGPDGKAYSAASVAAAAAQLKITPEEFARTRGLTKE